jgi:hypothetical protein
LKKKQKGFPLQSGLHYKCKGTLQTFGLFLKPLKNYAELDTDLVIILFRFVLRLIEGLFR